MSLNLLFLPLIVLPLDSQSSWNFGHVLLDSRRLSLLIRSVLFSGMAGILCSIVGFAAAMGLSSIRQERLQGFRWAPLAMLAFPPSIHSLAWNLILSKLRVFGLVWLPQEGWLTAFLIQIMSLLPLCVGFGLLGLYRLQTELIDVARVFQSERRIFSTVVLPQMRPWLLASAALAFVLSLADYSTPLLEGCNTYALEIFSQFAASHDAGRALILSIPLLIPILLATLMVLKPIRNVLLSENRPDGGYHLETRGWPFAIGKVGLLILAVQSLTPLIMLGFEIGSWKTLYRTLVETRSDLSYSLIISCAAALLALLPAIFLSGIFRKHQRMPVSGVAAIFLLTIPASLIGIGWSRVALEIAPNSEVLRAILPVGALLSRLAPIAVIVLFAWSCRIEPGLLNAASLFQRSRLQLWRRILIPMGLPALGAAAGLVFAFSLGELGASLMVLPPGRMTLSVRLYNSLHYGASELVAAMSLMLAVVCLGGGVCAVVLLRRLEHS